MAALSRHLPQLNVNGASAGLHLHVDLPHGYDEDVLVAAAARKGVAVLGGATFFIEGECSPSLVLGYGDISDDAIEPGIKKLASLFLDGAM